MGSGLRARFLIAALLTVSTVACAPLYGSKPEKLAIPPKKKKPPEAPVVAAEIKWVEKCVASFRDDPKTAPKRETALSNKLTSDGDNAYQASDKAKDAQSGATLIKESIDKFSNALRKDPYNAEATLKLALAYHKVYRKTCALAMLTRLQSLSRNPKVSPDAGRMADSVVDNTTWFEGYRQDAVTAVGR